jgi:hypothetical protein
MRGSSESTSTAPPEALGSMTLVVATALPPASPARDRSRVGQRTRSFSMAYRLSRNFFGSWPSTSIPSLARWFIDAEIMGACRTLRQRRERTSGRAAGRFPQHQDAACEVFLENQGEGLTRTLVNLANGATVRRCGCASTGFCRAGPAGRSFPRCRGSTAPRRHVRQWPMSSRGWRWHSSRRARLTSCCG